MILLVEIEDQIARLGGEASGELTAISWPNGVFSWSIDRIRKEYPEYANESEYELEDIFHPIRDLEFVQGASGFYPEWKDHFTGTDPERFIPFSSDEAFFYFVDVSKTTANPKVFYIDHETTDEKPYHHSGLDLLTFLNILE